MRLNKTFKKSIAFLSFLIFFILPLSSKAEESGVAPGLLYGPSKGIALGEYSSFNPDKTNWGYYRYGSSSPRFYLGNGVGIRSVSVNGVIVDKWGPAVVGFEPASVGISLSSNKSAEENFYQWFPAFTTGLKFGSFLVLARAGGSAGTYGFDGALPRFRCMGGGSIYWRVLGINLSSDYLRFGQDGLMSSISVQTKMFGLRLENNRGLSDERSGLLFIKVSS